MSENPEVKIKLPTNFLKINENENSIPVNEFELK
jgi:hypothetical protein